MSDSTEQQIFKQLEELTASEGYIHALAYLVYRDYKVVMHEELSGENFGPLYSRERLIRTEISTLIGLMLKSKIDTTLPHPSITQKNIDETERLLNELHQSMLAHFKIDFEKIEKGEVTKDDMLPPEVLREAIYYAPESAYHFQYREFSEKRYQNDEDWTQKNKKFKIVEASHVFQKIVELQNHKLNEFMDRKLEMDLDKLTLLEPFEFTLTEVIEKTGLDKNTVEAILTEFSLSTEIENNKDFLKLNDFNEYNSKPLISHNDKYISFLSVSNWESLYESPFFWMMQDKGYRPTSLKHRGDFTEEISFELLGKVFGSSNVYKNLILKNTKNEDVGEIDVLVEYAGRVFIIQAKSKKLTLLARAGNEKNIKDDFKKSVLDSYSQGKSCANLILQENIRILKEDDTELHLKSEIAEIFIFCIVSDHYPALSSQVQGFLEYETTDIINAPFVLDVFTLDTITEFLDNPLLFINYIKKRVMFNSKLSAMHETVILGYHLKNNLWVQDDVSMMFFDDTIASDLDAAMVVRRDKYPGPDTPDGILTRYQGTTLWGILNSLAATESQFSVEFSEMVSSVNEETFFQLNSFIERVCSETLRDGQKHDASMTFIEYDQGLTIHSSLKGEIDARVELNHHCKLRKYVDRLSSWIGVHINPKTKNINFILRLSSPWERNHKMDILTSGMVSSREHSHKKVLDFGRQKFGKKKIGRNTPCPCGSGKKFKRCCGK